MAYTTGDGNGDDIPAFEFRWHGPSSLVPIAGTYVGRNALAQFFGLVFDPSNGVAGFAFNTAFAPNTYGVRVPAYNCQFAIAQWQEMSQVISSGKTVSYGDNTVVYTFLNGSYPYIVSADVWVDGGQYQDAFGPGQINCNDYNTVVVQNCSADTLASAVAFSSSSTEDPTLSLLVLVVILGAMNFVLLIVLLAGFFGCNKDN